MFIPGWTLQTETEPKDAPNWCAQTWQDKKLTLLWSTRLASKTKAICKRVIQVTDCTEQDNHFSGIGFKLRNIIAT